MVALATQKFIADVAVDALQHCKQRQAQTSSKKQAGKVRILRLPGLYTACHKLRAMHSHRRLPWPRALLLAARLKTSLAWRGCGVWCVHLQDKRHVLCNIDLQAALKEHGVNINKVRRLCLDPCSYLL